MTQQVRNPLIGSRTKESGRGFLIRNRDSKSRVIKAPVRTPRAQAYAERWVGSLRRDCLDRLLILGRRHL